MDRVAPMSARPPLALASTSGQREHTKVAAPDPRVASLHSAARQSGDPEPQTAKLAKVALDSRLRGNERVREAIPLKRDALQ